MTGLIHVIMAGLTDPGRVRSENEDRIATHPELGLAVLADGMGGHQAGEVASGMAVDIVTRHFESREWQPAPEFQPTQTADEPETVMEAIRKANTAIYEAAQARPDYRGMGSTIVVATFYDNRMCVGHVGDSRLYRFRSDTLEQITRDHSVVQELVTRGIFTADEARQSLAKNLVTRALGVDAGIEPDVTETTVQNGDIYLLCSDGLNDVLTDIQIGDSLRRHNNDLDQAVRDLVDGANTHGGPDNISVILVRIDSDTPRSNELDEI